VSSADSRPAEAVQLRDNLRSDRFHCPDLVRACLLKQLLKPVDLDFVRFIQLEPRKPVAKRTDDGSIFLVVFHLKMLRQRPLFN